MSRFPELVLLLALATAGAAPQAGAADAAKGEKVFRQCAACHAVGADARHKIGPELNDVVGRTAGTAQGYNYSSAMKGAGKDGLVWSQKTLDEYLANPRAYVKGNRMSYAGLKKESDRVDLIAYLQTFSQAAKTGTRRTENSGERTDRNVCGKGQNAGRRAAPARRVRAHPPARHLPSRPSRHAGRDPCLGH